jgi:hypothetical protein
MATPKEIQERIEQEDHQRAVNERIAKQAAEAVAHAQAQQYTEAPVSFNVTCYVKGFKCGFTVRNGDPAELAKKIPGIISYLERIGATPTPGRAEASADPEKHTPPQPAVEAAAAPVCECGEKGVYLAGENERGPWCGYKCPRCDEFIKGTFRRAKSYKSDRTLQGAQN